MRAPSLLRLKILDAVAAFWGEHGYAPSVRDLCGLTGHSSTSVIKYHLDDLREEGLLTYEDRISRSIVLTEKGRCAIAPTTTSPAIAMTV